MYHPDQKFSFNPNWMMRGSPAFAEQGIYFATMTTAGPALEFFSFASGRVSEVARLSKGPERNIPGLAVSPDGRSLLYVQADRSGSDLMMVKDFR